MSKNYFARQMLYDGLRNYVFVELETQAECNIPVHKNLTPFLKYIYEEVICWCIYSNILTSDTNLR